MNAAFFNFIWNNKPDKVKRIYITQDYQDAGLKMVHLENFIMSLKIRWIDKLLKYDSVDFILLFEKTISPIGKLFNLGTDWTKLLAQKLTNTFWKEVLLSWIKLTALDTVDGNIDILSASIWYNPLISSIPMFLPIWYNRGITMVGDIVNSSLCMLELVDIERKFNFTINFLEYFRVRHLVNKFVLAHKREDYCSIESPPYIPKNICFLILNKSGTRGIYNKINKIDCEMDFQRKWHSDIDLELNRKSWQQKFRICFKTVQNQALIWFQYRILHRILGTQNNLCKMGISKSSTCLLCDNDNETLYHLFFMCPKSKQLWNELEQLIVIKTGFQISFDSESILLGYGFQNLYSVALNTLIIVSKNYIFSNSRKGLELNIRELLSKLKNTYNEQQTIQSLEMQGAKFERSWIQLKTFLLKINPDNL